MAETVKKKATAKKAANKIVEGSAPSDGGHPTEQSQGNAENVVPTDDAKGNPADYVGPRKEVERDFAVAQEADPRRQLPGGHGVYLDREERKRAEVARAQVEGREPDLDNPPPIAGTPTYFVEVLAEKTNAQVSNIPVAFSQDVPVGTDDPTNLAPEQYAAYEESGGTVDKDQKEAHGVKA